jgi:hypothetical protein
MVGQAWRRAVVFLAFSFIFPENEDERKRKGEKARKEPAAAKKVIVMVIHG